MTYYAAVSLFVHFFGGGLPEGLESLLQGAYPLCVILADKVTTLTRNDTHEFNFRRMRKLQHLPYIKSIVYS